MCGQQLIADTEADASSLYTLLSSNRQIIIPVHMQHGNVEVTGQIQGLHDVGFINHAILLQGLVHVELCELKLAAAGSAYRASPESSQ